MRTWHILRMLLLGPAVLWTGPVPADNTLNHISSVTVESGTGVVRLVVYKDEPNPAGCTNAGNIIDIPLDGPEGGPAAGLVNNAYLALINHHLVRLDIDPGACSAGSARVLSKIMLLRNRHKAEWPLGEKRFDD